MIKSSVRLALGLALLVNVVSARATTITLDVGLSDPYALGEAINGIRGNGGQANRDAIMVNHLLSLGLGTSGSFTDGGDTSRYDRTLNNFGSLPAATVVGAVATSGIGNGGALLSITLSAQYQYLLAAYDGENGGAEVWYIGGLAAGTIIQIPRYAEPLPGQDGILTASTRYLMTGWTLLNPGGPPPEQSVPDGGATIMLLGSALSALGMGRRFLKS